MRHHQDLRPNAFWDKVPRLHSMWRDIQARWPDGPRQGDRDRSDDPPGSWRGDGNHYLNPEENAEADRAIATLRAPEKDVTRFLLQLQDDNPYGGHLVGLDHRLKGDARIKEKIVEELKGEPGLSVAKAASRVWDAVRYTYCFTAEQYVAGQGYIRDKMISAGHQMPYCRNRWADDPQYKGINSRWTPPGGGRFELQFHTPESFYAKEQLTHVSYERLRLPGLRRVESARLRTFERTVCQAVPSPPRISEVVDFPGRKDNE